MAAITWHRQTLYTITVSEGLGLTGKVGVVQSKHCELRYVVGFLCAIEY